MLHLVYTRNFISVNEVVGKPGNKPYVEQYTRLKHDRNDKIVRPYPFLPVTALMIAVFPSCTVEWSCWGKKYVVLRKEHDNITEPSVPFALNYLRVAEETIVCVTEDEQTLLQWYHARAADLECTWNYSSLLL